MPAQQQNVIASLTKRGDIYLNNREPVIEIETKTSLLTFLFQIAIRSRDRILASVAGDTEIWSAWSC